MQQINTDLLGSIFLCFQEVLDVCISRQVCKKWKVATEQNLVWQPFITRDWPNAVMSLQDLKETDILPDAPESSLFYEYYLALVALQESKVQRKLQKNLLVEWNCNKPYSTKDYECGTNHKYHAVGCALRGDVADLRTLLTEDPSQVNVPSRYTWWHYYGNFSGGYHGYIDFKKEHYYVQEGNGGPEPSDRCGTPLHWAAIGGQLETTKVLVEEFGADIDALVPLYKVTAQDIATQNEHYGVAAYLKQAAKEKKKTQGETQST